MLIQNFESMKTSILAGLVGLFIGLASCSTLPAQSPIQYHHATNSDDFIKRLYQSNIHQPEIYARAVSVLESQRTMPSCHRVAMSNLMDTCQILERGETSETKLTEIREIFATRLAMCELSGVQGVSLSECLPFVQSQDGCDRRTSFMRYFRQEKDTGEACFPDITQNQLRSCLKVLNARPQLWTSYSNNLQNVLTVCQASRNAIEMEDIVSIHKSSTETTKDLTKVLEESLRQAGGFVSEMEAFQNKLATELNNQLENSQSLFGTLTAKVQTGLLDLLGNIKTGSDMATVKLLDITSSLEQVETQINFTDQQLSSLLSTLRSQTSSLAQTHDASLSLLHSRTQEVDVALQDVITSNMAALEKSLHLHLQHLHNFTMVVQESNKAMELQISGNNKRLEVQAEKIKELGAGVNNLANWVVMMSALWQMIRTWSPMAAHLLLVLAAWFLAFKYLVPRFLMGVAPNILSIISFDGILDLKDMVLIWSILLLILAVTLGGILYLVSFFRMKGRQVEGKIQEKA
jgi:hypothetical protein